MEDERHLMMAILSHLQHSTTNPSISSESLQQAISLLSSAYSLDVQNTATQQRYPSHDLSLLQIFKAGREQLLNTSTSSPTTSDPIGFDRFVQKLHDTTPYFKDLQPSSTEYHQRLQFARERYLSKLTSTHNSPTPTDKQQAEKYKEDGNTALKSKQFEKALQLYNHAIELDNTNPIYYSNRAAAYLRLSDHTSAIQDCQKSISLDATFMRPRERLASAYRALGKTKEEIDTLEDTLKIRPTDEMIQKQLDDARGRLEGGVNQQQQQDPLAALMGGAGGMPDANAMSRMAQSMGLNLNPAAMEQFMGSGGMEQVGRMVRENPALMQMGLQAMMGGRRDGGDGTQGNQ